MQLARSMVMAAALLASAFPATAQVDDSLILRNSRTLVLADLAGLPPAVVDEALADLHAYGGIDLVPSLILALRYNRPAAGAIAATLAELTGETRGDRWFDWMLWQEAHPEVKPHATFSELKTGLLTALDERFGRFVPLSTDTTIRLEEVAWGGVAVDGIPALDDPKLIAAEQADYLVPGELVFGVAINGDARAYPLRILDWHEMLNDVVGGVPVTLAYCTLCGSGILFDGRVDGLDKPLTFGTSGLLYRSNKLMYDRNTDSLWNQFTGRPVSGPLVAENLELRMLPVAITSWRDWKVRNPETQVLALDTGYVRDYTPGAAYGHYFNSPDLMFPALADVSARPLKDFVFGIRTTGGAKAWPLDVFRDRPVLNDRVGLTEVVLVGQTQTRTVRAYRRDGRKFTAGPGPDKLSVGDQRWMVTEEALVGPAGERLSRVPGHVAFWFAWSGFVGEAR